jgi:hypothetical protein
VNPTDNIVGVDEIHFWTTAWHSSDSSMSFSGADKMCSSVAVTQTSWDAPSDRVCGNEPRQRSSASSPCLVHRVWLQLAGPSSWVTRRLMAVRSRRATTYKRAAQSTSNATDAGAELGSHTANTNARPTVPGVLCSGVFYAFMSNLA